MSKWALVAGVIIGVVFIAPYKDAASDPHNWKIAGMYILEHLFQFATTVAKDLIN